MRLQITSTGPERGVVAVEAGEWTIAAIVEDGAGRGEPEVVREIVAEAVAEGVASDAAPSEWPARIAARISERLAARGAGTPSWLFYAGLAIRGAEAHVCTAGDLRVHLLQGGRALECTRDHILGNESPEWVRSIYGDSARRDHGSMASRSLGRSLLPPESVHWPLAEGWSIVVCSSAIHGHRAPAAYLAGLSTVTVAGEDGALCVRIEGPPAASDPSIVREIALAREACDPERLHARVAGAALTPAEALAAGEALAELAEAYLEAHADDDDDDLEDRADGWRRRAAALQIEGGAAWELELDGGERLTGGGEPFFYLRTVLRTLESADPHGFTLRKPVEVTLEWPEAAARDMALRLAEETLREARGCDDVAELLTDVEVALEQARAGGGRAEIHARLLRTYRRLCGARSVAIAAAEEKETDVEANRGAYRLQLAAIVADVALTALGESLDFYQLFGAVPLYSTGRVGFIYPKFALEHCLDRYYSLTDAGFDELFTFETDLEAKVALRELEALLRASLRAARG